MSSISVLKSTVRRTIGASLAVAAVALSASVGTAQSAPSNTFRWEKMEGQANDIGVARDHILWIVNNSTQPNGEYQLYTWNPVPKNWVDQKMSGVRVFAESGSDAPYVLKKDGQVWRRVNGTWTRTHTMQSMTAFASAGVNTMATLPDGQGRQFMIANDPDGLPGGVYQYSRDNSRWESLNNKTRMKKIAADRFGNLWAIDETNYVWQYFMQSASWNKFGGQMGTAVAIGGTYGGGADAALVYIVGMDKTLYKLVGDAFVKSGGNGANLMEIASDEAGNVWSVTQDRQIFKGVLMR